MRHVTNAGNLALAAVLAIASPLIAAELSPLLLPCGETRLDSAALPALRAELIAATNEVAVGESTKAYILQYDPEATLSSAVRKPVKESGATLLAPVSGGAYLARATAAQTLAILDAGVIAAARASRAEDKIAASCSGSGVFVVSLFPDADETAAIDETKAVPDCEVLDSSAVSVRVRCPAAALPAVAAIPLVQSIGPWLEPELNLQ